MDKRRKVIARVIIAVLAGIALGGTLILVIGPSRLLPPLPPSPTITAARGEMPAGVVAFEQRIQTEDGYQTVGAGFLLRLPNADVIGVTTKHSTGDRPFVPTVFTIADRDATVATFTKLYAPIGHPFANGDLTTDYILMRPDAPPDPAIVLLPDPRSAPQPGERVSLFSGRGDGQGGQRILSGTVESAFPASAWIRIDGIFDPRGMSGSPVISQHTGQVVGMIVAASPRIGTIVIGIDPIGSIIDKAASNR